VLIESKAPGESTLLTLPQTGKEDDDHNPDGVKARNLFNVGVGTDNLFHKEQGARVTPRFAVENLTNKVTLYNFRTRLGTGASSR
jgi:hypothetical protein